MSRSLRSSVLHAAVPRLIEAVCREIHRRGLTPAEVEALYPINRHNLYKLRAARVRGNDGTFGPDRMIALAEALGIDTQPLLYPPAPAQRMAA